MCIGLSSFPSWGQESPFAERWDCHTMARENWPRGRDTLLKARGLPTSSTSSSLAMITPGRCKLPDTSSYLWENQSSPGSPAFTVRMPTVICSDPLSFWRGRFGAMMDPANPPPLSAPSSISSTPQEAWLEVGTVLCFPLGLSCCDSFQPTGQETSKHLSSCFVHPDYAFGNWGRD